MEKQKAKIGTVRLEISKEDNDPGYKGKVLFSNSEVLAEALAVMMLRAAIELEVSIDMLYAKVASLLFVQEDEADG